MKKIGIITIGQSPRVDVVNEMGQMIGGHIDIIERGALDGLSLEQAKAYAPEKEMMPLCTRMKDGTEVMVAKEKLIPGIQDAVDELNQKQVSAIMLLCVGDFPKFKSDCLIVEPKRVVVQSVAGLIDEHHHLGILLPVPEQEAWARKTFGPITKNITITEASPYSNPEKLKMAADTFKNAGCDLMVMFCMGFNKTLAKVFRDQMDIPVMVSSSMLARVMAEIME
ncbi:MAG: AroM family protein [Desulfobacterales bacterium]|nr:AroM family protein [Desulfobacterales bacterium]